MLVTGIPWRTGWRYRERGYRHIYWDAGTMLAQFLALADSAGLPARLYTRFPDAEVAALTGADRVHEFPVAVVALDEAPPALDPAGPAARGEVDAAPLEFPLVTAAQRAGESDRLGPGWDRGRPVNVPLIREHADRARHRRARVPAADGREPRPAPGPAAQLHERGRARHSACRTGSCCTTSMASLPACTAGPA